MEVSHLPPQEDGENHIGQDQVKSPASQEANMNNMQKHPHANSRTPEPQVDRQASNSDTPDTPGALEPFDWDEYEARYEAALRDADEQEREILKEADALSKYFKVWASAASAHDDERAAKRLQTRRRFVNLSEERMERKQEHYDQVVKAFENALALLRSQ
ncbi:Ff.00g089440.m01.CDS01 [Fusarium sp. VM40]|nr:Ff.00g089440.m01.CDS01 [Fusarium sp. VM40]